MANIQGVEQTQVGDRFYVKRESGLWLDDRTTEEQAEVIERAKADGLRIRVHYGDAETGSDWGDIHDVEGRVGQSLGRIQVPLLIAKSRSMGGGEIMTHCLVRVRYSNRRLGGDLYVHPDYHLDPDVRNGLSDADYQRHFAAPLGD